jgi:hypothetical protein
VSDFPSQKEMLGLVSYSSPHARVGTEGSEATIPLSLASEKAGHYGELAEHLGYGDTAQLGSALEEVSRLLSVYAAAILTSSTSGS